VIRNVDTLSAGEQKTLLEWLESATTRTQVITTATAALTPLVEAGAFDETLYYRLNTVYIDLSE
jgi:transcriptional regulator of acetoin/glycerol metabolism